MAKALNINVSTDKIKDYLMDNIDNTNPIEVEKVGRYIKYIEMYRDMDKTVKKEGASQTTKNASQEFVKSHPLLNEMDKANKSIMAIEKTFNFIEKDSKEDQPSASDLI